MKNILAKNLLILASAGSGKTYQLGNRVIGLIGRDGVPPDRMVALTFTRKAAGEFADSVLTKLAQGSLDPDRAGLICRDVKAEFDLSLVLEKVIRSLPRLQFTTLDGFFSRVVRGFQYELGLTGGTFDLLEGERLETAKAEILQGVLQDGFRERQDFYFAFRKATLGRGEQGVQRSLEDFVKDWHIIWKSGVGREAFGNTGVFQNLPKPQEWGARKDGLIATLREASTGKTWDKVLDVLDDYVVGTAPVLNAFGKRLLEALDQQGPVTVKDGRNQLTIAADTWKIWQSLFQLIIGVEMASAVAKTEAVGELMAQIDHEHAVQLRRRGLLGFDDVKSLLGEWSQNEEARVKRELIDYRLDGKYDHWLLDEFQDTSQAEWQGLLPLIDEAVSDPEGSFFVVGDRKQGIYGWRGGDVTLFEDVLNRFRGGLEVEPMDVSFRSCPAVLALVNAVCGNLGVIEKLFGRTVRNQWQWKDHLAANLDLTGEGKVIEVPKGEDGPLLVEELRRLGIGKKNLNCGVLVRKTSQVKHYADLLRAEGFDVIEAGHRTPGEDHAVGVTIKHLIQWLANPADEFSREVVGMSPIGKNLECFGDHWGKRWDSMMREIQRSGYARFVSRLITPEWTNLGLYGRRRAEDFIGALVEFDRLGEACPRAAATWIKDLKVNQAPGVAAIQVMTIHKSKGLGFDVVMLPEVPDRKVPDATNFKVARGEGWVLQAPGKWAYEQFPETKEAYERWGEAEKYEALCLWYVALTRAKRGLYVFLPEEPRSRKGQPEGELFASPANLIRQSTGIPFPEADPAWADEVEAAKVTKESAPPKLPAGVAQRSRINPASRKAKVTSSSGGSGRFIGIEVHRLFESIEWLDPDEIPKMPFSAAGKIVEDALKIEAIHAVFEKQEAELYREQAFELIAEGKWMSGVVDRLHVFREGGVVTRVEVIDFKTDKVANHRELCTRYDGQIAAYRAAVGKVFAVGPELVNCRLLSTFLGEVVNPDDFEIQGELEL
jgi:ATP-dependent exoDNAse (exonuclease V) beta subunit